MKTGLVSVSFRQLSPGEIVELASKAGLNAIEWGGDVHVPHGDLNAAREVRALTESAGLTVSSYGSYYRAGETGVAFEQVLASAVALGAPLIRIWAGSKSPRDADEDYRQAVARDIAAASDQAEKVGVKIGLEFHRNTLTETGEEAKKLLAAIRRENVLTYWQPPLGSNERDNLDFLREMSGAIPVLHVYHWLYENEKLERLPLAEGAAAWEKYLMCFNNFPRETYALLEFVRDDSPEQFLADAAVLQKLAKGVK